MKILHAPFGFYPDAVGGTEVYVASLARELAALGHESVIAAPGKEASRYAHAGLEVRRFAVSAPRDPAEIYGAEDPAAASAFDRILAEEKPDLVHLHALTRGVSPAMAEAAKARRLPVFFTYHTPTVACARGSLVRWGREACDGKIRPGLCAACNLADKGVPAPLARLAAALPVRGGDALGSAGLRGGVWTVLRMRSLVDRRRRAFARLEKNVDRFVAVTGWACGVLLRNGVPAAKITLSTHGIRAGEAAPPPPRPSGDPRLAFVGRLHPTKGLDVLLEAVRAEPLARLSLDVYGVCQPGDEAYASGLRDRAKSDPRVRFLAPVENEKLAAALAPYDALLVPSQWMETGPLVVLESFAAGVPVVGSRLGGIPDLVRDGVDGLLVSPFDSPAAWGRALRSFAADKSLLEGLRRGVRPPRRMAEVAREMDALYRAARGNAR